MKYIKRTVRAAVFLLGMVLILALLSPVFAPKDNTEEAGMEEVQANGFLGEKDNTLDYVIVGDSLCMCSVSPMEIWKTDGYAGYVSSTGGQKLYGTKMLLTRIFAHQSPKLVIMEVNNFFYKGSVGDALLSELSDRCAVFWYHDRWKTLKPSEIGEKVQYTWTDICKGYHFKTEQVETSGEKGNYATKMKGSHCIRKMNRLYVEEIRKMCERHNAKLIFISIPSTANWDSERHEKMTAFAEKIGVPYIDLNERTSELGIDWNTDSMDGGDHLNYWGTEKVSSWLGAYLKELDLFSDHREDSSYAAWNTALEAYEEKTAEAA